MDLEKALGFESTPQAVSWNQRDLLTYAAGVSGLYRSHTYAAS